MTVELHNCSTILVLPVFQKSEVSSSYGRKTMSSGTSALQEALKEKQQHVESLMAERDIERSDMMQAIQEAAELNKAMEETKIQFQQVIGFLQIQMGIKDKSKQIF